MDAVLEVGVKRNLASTSVSVHDRPARELDDDRDREELRRRYYGLLQELRILLPGVQVLVAFLLTAPFAQRFSELDSLGRGAYGVSLMAGLIAVLAFVTPTAFHRIGSRTKRSVRLQWATRLTRVGLGFMALSLLSGLLVVGRHVFGTAIAVVSVALIGLLTMVAWIALPLSVGRHHRSQFERPHQSTHAGCDGRG